jgi:hypothetical protein
MSYIMETLLQENKQKTMRILWYIFGYVKVRAIEKPWEAVFNVGFFFFFFCASEMAT